MLRVVLNEQVRRAPGMFVGTGLWQRKLREILQAEEGGAALSRTEDRFDVAWSKLEKLGVCDALGGAEYRRVRSEYEFEADPGDVTEFIRMRTNVGPRDN